MMSFKSLLLAVLFHVLLLLLPGGANARTDVTVESMRADVTGNHDALMSGVPADWSWGSSSNEGAAQPPGSYPDPVFVPWWISATASTGSAATNTRVEVRNVIFDVRHNGTWSRVSVDNGTQLNGDQYDNYETNASSPANKIWDPDFSYKLNDGQSLHGMTTDRYKTPISGLDGIVTSIDVRLVVDDPGQKDDRDDARIVTTMSGDWWASPSQQWNSVHSNTDFRICRARWVTTEWTTITCSSSGLSDADFEAYVGWRILQK